ncbi:hypothetical protein FCL51_10785 [Elizabethkingia anophelis]|nr:hypothetical protein [Elizabethkingia anophelis]
MHHFKKNKKMKRKIQIITGVTLLSVLLTSCRSNDTENTLVGNGTTGVRFNLLGSDYSNNGNLAGSASLDKGNAVVSDNQIQSHSVLVTPSNVMTVKLLPLTQASKSLQASLNNTIAAISGNPLSSGTMFRVIAYRQSNGSYQAYQDYTIGQNATPMMLDNGVAYNMVVYTYGTNTLPSISSGEQSNISSAQVNYDDTNRDFMYQKIAFTPSGTTNNILNITLRHKVTQIITTVTTNFLSIAGISGGVLTSHYSNGVIPLSTGVMSGRTTLSTGAALSFPSSEFPGSIQTANPVFINNNTGSSLTGGFSANVTIGATTKVVNLPNIFTITPENQSNLTINLQRCGAYLGPGNTQWKEFMCHNLGADNTADPFAAVAAIHGAKYQWGAQTDQVGRYYSQVNDQVNSGAITGWIGTLSGGARLPDGTWSDTSKTANDPCPSGYRVPTNAQWTAVANNNNFTSIGSWGDSATNYSSGAMLGNNLFLPATGRRSADFGTLVQRGAIGDYWSSTPGTGFINAPNAYTLHLQSFNASGGVINNDRFSGISVRCIAQ